jgi:hypothetical protein
MHRSLSRPRLLGLALNILFGHIDGARRGIGSALLEATGMIRIEAIDNFRDQILSLAETKKGANERESESAAGGD